MSNNIDRGAGAGFIEAAQSYFNQALPMEEVLRLRDHGVTSAYFRELSYNSQKFRPDEIVALIDNGVSLRFMSNLRKSGRQTLTASDLIKLVRHGLR